MKHIQQIICILLVTVLLFSAAALPCAAADNHTVEPNSQAVRLDLLDPQLWSGNDAILYISSRAAANRNALYVFARDKGDSTLSISAPFDEPLDLSSLRELAFAMHISGSGTCDFTVTFLCKGTYYNASSKVTAGGEPTVYLPIPEGAKGPVDALAITLSRVDEPIKSFSLLSVTGDERFSYAHTDRFMSTGFEPTAGIMQEQEDCVFVTPQNGSASFYPRYITGSRNKEGSAAVYLRIRSTQASGTISIHGVTGATPLTILSGEHTYGFLINGSYSDMEYVFSGISAAQEAPLVITGAAIHLFSDSITEGIGSITSCRSDGKTVTVKGTLSPDTVVEHINSELALYAIPIWTDETEVLQKEPAAKMSISTRFELSTVPDGVDALYRYKVMIVTENDKIPIAPSAFISSGGTISAIDSSVTGIHGTDTVDVFESNVSNVIVDVYANRLLETNDVYAALLYAAGNTHYYFNRSYLEELDAQIQFCKSSGTKVYIRLLHAESDEAGYTNGEQESVTQLYALTAFLAQRYQGITGFILGSHANLEYHENIETYASFAAIFSAVVKKHCPGAAAVIPVCDAYTDSTAAEGISAADPVTFLCQLSVSLNRKKSDSIMILYESNTLPERAVTESAYLSSLVTVCGHPCDGSMLFWQPSAGTDTDISATYQSLCMDAARAGLRSVILSVSNLNASNVLFNGIKETVFKNTSAGLLRRVAEQDNSDTYLGMYPLWDFTVSYDIGGWVSGGGCSSVISANAQNDTGRVLQTRLESPENGAGILLCWLNQPLDLTDSSVKFSFGLYDVPAEGADISIIFGSGDSRAEYSLTAEQNAILTATCNLKDFSDTAKVEYIAVILRSDSNPLLEISKIELCSNTKSTEQLQLLAKGDEKEEKQLHPAFYFIIVIMTAATVIIFSMLERKNNRTKSKKRMAS